ncbi:MAG: GtrA family protein [Coriobacteriia bacterium]|nr:GtrA family protein [Coriobacteriia bacterium]
MSSRWFKLDERMRYVFVGGWNTIFAYGLYVILVTLVGARAYVWLLVPVTIVSVTQSFYLHKYLVFRTRGGHLREYLRFYIVYGPVLIVNMFVLPALVGWLGLDPRIAQGVFTAVAIAATYLANKYFTFGSPEQRSEEGRTL